MLPFTARIALREMLRASQSDASHPLCSCAAKVYGPGSRLSPFHPAMAALANAFQSEADAAGVNVGVSGGILKWLAANWGSLLQLVEEILVAFHVLPAPIPIPPFTPPAPPSPPVTPPAPPSPPASNLAE